MYGGTLFSNFLELLKIKYYLRLEMIYDNLCIQIDSSIDLDHRMRLFKPLVLLHGNLKK